MLGLDKNLNRNTYVVEVNKHKIKIDYHCIHAKSVCLEGFIAIYWLS